MLKTILAILLGKSIFFLSRILELGGGFAAPGLYALKVDPNLVSKLTKQVPLQVIITGTNGKTTTASMLAHIYSYHGDKVIRNQTGSNLERGIASTIINKSSLFGKLDQKVAIWEVDEAAFNSLAPKIKPDLIVFLNVFRDQLDRYGEVDSIVSKWLQTIKNLPDKTQFLINGDDGSLEPLFKTSNTHAYSVKGISVGAEKTATKKTNSRFFAHHTKDSFEKISFSYMLDDRQMHITLPLSGNYNIYNATAALSSKFLLGGLGEKEAASLKDFKPQFGRSEKFKVGDKEVSIFLIKNPVGATQVLQTVVPHISPEDSLLIALNDNFADGTDVSWIWDAEFERVKGKKVKIFVSGQRAYDMALRLKYAEAKDLQIEPELDKAFEKAVDQTKGKLFILPTYTALMELQKILVKKGIKKEYWSE